MRLAGRAGEGRAGQLSHHGASPPARLSKAVRTGELIGLPACTTTLPLPFPPQVSQVFLESHRDLTRPAKMTQTRRHQRA
ncbi:uncharacterized protein UV8b_02797 [Ustilaginoidea virens]|uniref:Uncharacterized protein n=1 Tax=Ustilaginoidea virens TaxID=1159556 RepID=A0A8E5MG76_USTVR|nr:uncharacterized protein UV8b_02797 [Ustilaginoidea virens]QUC18556.1 hypothetical protein UV8b_02797 [Ustilaginoidea virens]